MPRPSRHRAGDSLPLPRVRHGSSRPRPRRVGPAPSPRLPAAHSVEHCPSRNLGAQPVERVCSAPLNSGSGVADPVRVGGFMVRTDSGMMRPNFGVIGRGAMNFRRAVEGVLGLVSCMMLYSCAVDLSVPGETHIRCQSDSDCPSGWLCRSGACVRTEVLNTAPPDLASAPEVTPALGRAGTPFRIALSVTKALLEPPQVTLQAAASIPIECASDDSLAYHCDYVATGDEFGGDDGVVRPHEPARPRSRPRAASWSTSTRQRSSSPRSATCRQPRAPCRRLLPPRAGRPSW